MRKSGGLFTGEVKFHQNRFQVGVGYLPGVETLGDQRQLLKESPGTCRIPTGVRKFAPVGPRGPPAMGLFSPFATQLVRALLTEAQLSLSSHA